MKIYTVFYTYMTKYADRPITVIAKNPTDAIEKAFGFYANDKWLEAGMRFFVVEGKVVATACKESDFKTKRSKVREDTSVWASSSFNEEEQNITHLEE